MVRREGHAQHLGHRALLFARAEKVTISRDESGIPHVHGETDADAVFGLMYAQAEDDFNRLELNLLSALGRLAESEGITTLYNDLRVRLFMDESHLKACYAGSPIWLRALMDAWAHGLNFFLASHCEVKPRVIRHYEPWMALSFVEGGILGDLARVPLDDLQNLYRAEMLAPTLAADLAELSPNETGSNAFAVAPENTRDGNALLIINPHPDFYFRAEVHLSSDEGLNCYGAATWGQFFITQGFNEQMGWGHTTSGSSALTEYLEQISTRGAELLYLHGAELKPLEIKQMTITFATPGGAQDECTFETYRTHHGPIIRRSGNDWVSLAMMSKPVEALTQAVLRMKAQDFTGFRLAGEQRANSILNAVYADRDGNIAYFHPQFVPRRDERFDFLAPVDGSDPLTDWQGEHRTEELPNVINPPNGWIVNTNDAAYQVAGRCSPKENDYPAYMDTAGINPRGINAARLLEGRTDLTLDTLVEIAYDPALTAFERLIPDLVGCYDQLSDDNRLKHDLADQIAVLRAWDCRYGVRSIATTLAVTWGDLMFVEFEPVARQFSPDVANMFDYFLKGRTTASFTARTLMRIFDHMINDASAGLKLEVLARACEALTIDFGTWKVEWGKINRFQRISGSVIPHFDDQQSSYPVPLTSSIWGALACFKSHRAQNMRKRYGVAGNSFVMVVEFGPRLRAKAIVPGGVSGDPSSRHFNDQADRFVWADLREVHFYPDEIEANADETYHPGKRETRTPAN